MKSNVQQLALAKKDLGESCPVCCSMRNNCCCYFVAKSFKSAGNASLFYGGQMVTYCPNAIKWCKANLAQIPLFLAMPSDIVFFDWNGNNVPDHIGFVDHRINDQEIRTFEGNTTNRFVVAYQTRPAKYVLGIFRPHFKATYTIGTLKVDGQFDYQSIAMLQKALGIKADGILGKDTIKALQKKVGVTQDGSWGANTSKAVQKLLKKEGVYKGEIDGCVYLETVKALQTWINKKVGKTTTTTDKTPTASVQKPTEAVTDDGKLTVDGSIGRKTVLRMQEFFGTMKDGVISGQKEDLYKYYPSVEKGVIKFCDGGSQLVTKMQKWAGIRADGIWGQNTSKAIQKKLGVTADGIFGTNSAKALQKFLNENEKPIYPKGDALASEAEKYAWALGTESKKWDYDTGSARDSYKTALKKFMDYTSKVALSDCGYFLDICVRSLGISSDFLVLKGTKDPFPAVPNGMEVVHKGSKVPESFLIRGDVIRYKKTSGSQHTYMVMSDTTIAEAGRKTRFPVVRKIDANSKCNASGIKYSTIEVIRAK